jgi:hypothetical protein
VVVTHRRVRVRRTTESLSQRLVQSHLIYSSLSQSPRRPTMASPMCHMNYFLGAAISRALADADAVANTHPDRDTNPGPHAKTGAE